MDIVIDVEGCGFECAEMHYPSIHELEETRDDFFYFNLIIGFDNIFSF